MEELLNKLIKKGWKPRGESEPIYILSSKKLYIPDTMEVDRSLRDLVSKESGLWQFVCKNGMCKYVGGDRAKNYDEYANECDDCYSCDDYGYRLIESALCDEDKLEQFLLDTIKIDG